MTVDDALRRLTAGLAEDERIARVATPGPWRTITALERTPAVYEQDWLIATPQGYDDVTGYVGERHPGFIDPAANAEHIARFDPKAELRRVEAIRKVIAPYLADVDAVEATVSVRRDAVSRHALAALRLDHGSGDEMEELRAQERRAREELLSAEVQLASYVATRDAHASVISALADIYPEDTDETEKP